MDKHYEAKSFKPNDSVGYLLKRLNTELHRGVDRELEPLGLTSAQFSVMAQIVYRRADTPSAICDLLEYDRGAMTRMIDRLEEKGLLRRAPDEDDRRTIRLALTREGQELFPKLIARIVNVLNRFLSGFSEKEVDQLKSYLLRMLANA
jgi:DNA-binding MarR family transcriptional regulator